MKFLHISCLSLFLLSTITMGAMAQINQLAPPVMGWSSWNTYRIHINEALIKKQADAMVSQGLKEAGYLYVNVDDGFFGWRDENGKLQTHPERFPNGLKCVADYIHSKGLKAGIYSDAGSNTCGSIWDKDPNGVGVGLYGHEKQDADLFFNEWGFDFIKIDYCGAGQSLALEEQKRYTEIRQAIDAVCNRNISLNICRWAFPGTWAKDLARSWRISADITPQWESIKYIIGKNLYLSAYAGGGHYNDMDMLEIGRGLKPEEDVPKADAIRESREKQRQISRQITSFYQEPKESPRVDELERQVKELNEKLERERKGQDPLELMEKSYEMAARYFPGQTGGQVKNIQPAGVTGGSSGNPAAIAAGRATENVVSSLAVPPVPDTIPRNYGFATAVGGGQLTGANTIRACVAEDQTVTTGA